MKTVIYIAIAVGVSALIVYLLFHFGVIGKKKDNGQANGDSPTNGGGTGSTITSLEDLPSLEGVTPVVSPDGSITLSPASPTK